MKFLLDLLARSPFWAIKPEVAPLAVLALHEGLRADFDANGTWQAAKPHALGSGPNKIAVIPIQGVLTKDGPAWYGSNYDTIGRAVEDAAASPDVKRIILAVDSPGGEVTGLPETAALIAQAAKIKPVSAMVEGMAASAAYYLTSQASEIVLTPSGEVGSVGVRMMHMDVSKMLENFGITVTELQSGEFKTEWSPYKPLSEEAKADMLPRIQAVHQEFVDAVTAGRGSRASQDIQAGRYGEGRMFSSSAAVSHGLVDRLQSSRDFFRTMVPAPESDSTPGFPLRSRLEVDTARADKTEDHASLR